MILRFWVRPGTPLDYAYESQVHDDDTAISYLLSKGGDTLEADVSYLLSKTLESVYKRAVGSRLFLPSFEDVGKYL